MAGIRLDQERYDSTEFLSNRYGLKTRLRILCFIKDREIHDLKTNGAIIIKALNLNDEVYGHSGHISSLEKDGMIVRDEKRFITLTEQGDNIIKKNFFKIIPDYEANGLLKNFVQYLSSETKQFLKGLRSTDNFIPDRFINLIDEQLLKMYEDKFRKFCRSVEALEKGVN